jgi:hypothetical protein
MIIKLKYGGQFEVDDLIQFVKNSGRDYIIQGQQACAQADHTKRSSLDYWLRDKAKSVNTKQADNDVIAALVATGHFSVEKKLHCPDQKTYCKGLKLTK